MKKTIIASAFLLIIPVTVFSGYSAGRSHYIRKNYDKAKEEFLAAVESNPKDGNAYFFLGEIEKNAGNFKEAEEYYRLATEGRIERKFLNFAYWNYNLMVEQRGNPEDIVIAYKSFHDRMGNAESQKKIDQLIDKLLWTENEQAQTEYKAGTELKRSGKAAEALARFRKAVSADTSFLAPRYEIGMILLDSGDKNGAARELSAVVSKLPFYYGANRLLGDIYFTSGNYADASVCYSNCLRFGIISDDTEYTLNLRLATCAYNMKNYTEAAQKAERAASMKKNETDPLFILSAVYINNSEYSKALAALKSIDRLNPDSPQVIFQIGSIFYKQKNPEYAAYFDKLFSTAGSGNNTPEKFFRAYILAAEYHFSSGNNQGFVRIISAIPESYFTGELKTKAAKAYFVLGDYNKSAMHLESRTLSADEKILLARVHLKTGRRDKCRELLATFTADDSLREAALANRELAPLMKKIIQDAGGDADEVRKTDSGSN